MIEIADTKKNNSLNNTTPNFTSGGLIKSVTVQAYKPKKDWHFDALSHYQKYSDLFDIDSVPEAERLEVAQDVADWVLKSLKD